MTKSKPTFTTTFIPPPNTTSTTTTTLTLPTRTIPYPPTNPPGINDALAVRLQVFVDEQKCNAEFEIDDDDYRSWHWVIYDESFGGNVSDNDKIPNPTTNGDGGEDEDGDAKTRAQANPTGSQPLFRVPVAVIRLIPPPHAPHELCLQQGSEGEQQNKSLLPRWDLSCEPHIMLGRVAVLKEYRGYGLGRRVMETAMAWAAANADEINRAMKTAVEKEYGATSAAARTEAVWKGLVLLHAQKQAEKMYERLGFVTDETFGTWLEEGIDHVGMVKRLNIQPY